MRFVTTVPQQALFYLNSPFVAEQGRHLAARAEAAGGASAEDRIRHMYRFVFGRAPEKWELAAGLSFVSQSEDAKADAEAASPWQYGSGGSESFTPFPVFVSDRWQGGPILPAAVSGKAVLRAAGGEPGERPDQAVIRRWISSMSGKMSIEGTLRHGQPAVPYGDGVRGRIVSSRQGELASWSVNGSSAETRLSGVSIEKGDTIDFIVDAKLDPENDGFSWAPVIRIGEQSWNSKNDFAGPAAERLSIWARYAQVLMETNEFAFVE
jgi:hypothetical protein